MNAMSTDPPLPLPLPLTELIQSLEEAILAAKHPSSLLSLHTSLHRAHSLLSSALHSLPLPPPPPQHSESLSSSDDPMTLADDSAGGGEAMLEAVEEKMRDCFIRNTRRKRELSPSAAAIADEERRRVGEGEGFDPYATRIRALELVFQFHG